MSERKREIAERQPLGSREIFYKRLPRPCICSILGLHVGKSAKFFDLVYHSCRFRIHIRKQTLPRENDRTYIHCANAKISSTWKRITLSGSRSIHDTLLILLCAPSISDNLHFITGFFIRCPETFSCHRT